jgi:pyruvate dehydrogenase E1 component
MSNDLDPGETREWQDALSAVLEFDGADRAYFLLDELMHQARRNGAPVPYSANTPYLNTIAPTQEPPYPGDLALEHTLRSMIRWNAVAMVLRANRESSELGGHIISGMPRRRSTRAISSSSRGTARRASTPGRTWRAG